MRHITILIILFIAVVNQSAGQGPDNENLKIIHGPYLQNLQQNQVTIMWVTNKSSIPAVIVRDMDGNERTVQNSTDGIVNGGGVLHKVIIDGLVPGTTYSYKPVSTEVLRYQPYKVFYGDTLVRTSYSFTTLDKNRPEVRSIIMNDIHEKSYLISDYLEESGFSKADMVFFNGDIINHLQSEDQIFNGFLDSSVFYFAREIPFYFIRGNHETRGMLARSFKDYFDFPDNRFYYAFTQGPVHFVVLDCGEDKPDNNRYYFNLADYDSYRLRELEWLKQHIDSKEFKEASYRVVLIHMPVIKRSGMGHGMQFLSDHFGPVLKRADIDLLVAGHTHRVAYYSENESGFGYPVMVSSNKTFVELNATRSVLEVVMKESDGKLVMEKKY